LRASGRLGYDRQNAGNPGGLYHTKDRQDGMKGHNWVIDHHQILLPRDPAPRSSFILFSVFAHLVTLALVVGFWHAEKAHIVPEKYTVQEGSGAAHLSFNSTNSKATRSRISPLQVHRSARQPRAAEPGNATGVASAQTLREHAKQGTAAIMLSLKFRQVYGFSPTHDYQLAFRTAGEIPSISAADLRPRFEQYVVVEVTIDVDGRVADERIVAGMVDPPIEQKLLSAIREFKYSPAKRDGVPIPSQLDIVVHIPS
jgi:TonB family protein